MRLWSRPSYRLNMLLGLVVTLAATCKVHAYVPAYASSNPDPVAIASTDGNSTGKLYPTDTLVLTSFKSHAPGTALRLVYLAAGARTDGYSRGALALLSEENLARTDTNANVSWVALISCDRNSSIRVDNQTNIIDRAYDLGARAVVLYSEKAPSCVLNSTFRSSGQPPLDIWSLNSTDSFNQLLSTYQIDTSRDPATLSYNGDFLISQSTDISRGITSGRQLSDSFLLATLLASNATVMPPDQGSSSGTGGTTHGPPQRAASRHNNAGMLVLYVVTGLVSALFCAIIISGAMRAIRNPERYGPRAAWGVPGEGGGAAPQSRTQGLSRAIVDTFAVVRFRSPVPPNSNDPESFKGSDSTTDPDKSRSLSMDKANWEMVELPALEREGQRESVHVVYDPPSQNDSAPGSPATNPKTLPGASPLAQEHGPISAVAGPSTLSSSSPLASSSHPHSPSDFDTLPAPTPRQPRPAPTTTTSDPSVLPEAIGRETCPICIVDFEDDDALRVLPCAGQHRFHQACVDPWLLELSSSCPICRQDFAALENLIAGEVEAEVGAGHLGHDEHGRRVPGNHNSNGHSNGHSAGSRESNRSSHGYGRFSRYVRLARRRTRERRGSPLAPGDTQDTGTGTGPGVHVGVPEAPNVHSLPRLQSGSTPGSNSGPGSHFSTNFGTSREANVRRYGSDPTDPYMPVITTTL